MYIGDIMELAAKYAYKVFEQGSFSKAAEALYISQPALSATIAKLERELGFRIFDRSTSPIALTPKGQIYIDMLEETLNSEATMYKRLEQFSKGKLNQLGIGTSIFLANYLMPNVCKTMMSLYPNIRIRFNMGEKGSKKVLSSLLELKNIDFLIGYNYDNRAQASIPIANRKTLIAARLDLIDDELRPYAMNRCEALRGENTKKLDSANLHLLNNLPFITSDAYTGYHRKIVDLTENNYSLSNISIVNIRTMAMNYEMVSSGLGATITNNIDIIHPLFNDDKIVYFSVNKSAPEKPLCAIFRIEDKPSEEALRFIDIFKELLTTRKSDILAKNKL